MRFSFPSLLVHLRPLGVFLRTSETEGPSAVAAFCAALRSQSVLGVCIRAVAMYVHSMIV